MRPDDREWLMFLNARRGLLSSGISGIFTSTAEDRAIKVDFEATARMHPTHLPLGLDVELLKRERRRLHQERAQRVIRRLVDEYAQRTGNTPCAAEENVVDYLRSKENCRDAFLTLLQVRKVSLWQQQSILRRNVYRGIKEIVSPHAIKAAAASKAHQEENLYGLRALFELETRHLAAGKAKKRAWWAERLKAVQQAAMRIAQAAKDRIANQQRIFVATNAIHEKHKKDQERARKRAERARIQALKSNDEQEYLKLLKQEKNTRLTQILQRTDEHIAVLKRRIKVQKQTVGDTPAEGPAEGSAPAEEPSCTDYFELAHSVREQVKEQPKSVAHGHLREYQLKGVEWMVSLYNNKLNGILADEMGLGKTVQAVVFISYLIERKAVTKPFLVVVPLSTFSNWVQEFSRWVPTVRVLHYKGDPGQRREIKKESASAQYNVLLTTFEYVIRDRAFLSRIQWLYTIVDEGHRMKNASSKLCTVMNTYYSSEYRLLLTGTPLQNSLPELWALLNFVLPRIFHSGGSFEEWFNASVAHAGEKMELTEEEELLIIKRLHKVLRPFLLRRLKRDVEAGLPEKTERVIKCGMSGLQRSLYEEVRTAALSKKEGARRLNNTLMQLRKICNHPFVFSAVEDGVNPGRANNDLLYRVSGKFELLRRMLWKLHATGHKVLIFFQMTQVMTIMEDMLLMEGVKYLRLDGAVKSEERASLISQFNDPASGHLVFLLSTRAGGLGVNLQAADTVIIFDSDWNPHADQQAQDRAHRIGQTREVRIFRLVTADSIEEYILERANHKLHVDEKIIQAGRFDNRTTHQERDALLRSIFEETDASRDADRAEESTPAELNHLLARTPAELLILQETDRLPHMRPAELYPGPAPSLTGPVSPPGGADADTGARAPSKRRGQPRGRDKRSEELRRCLELVQRIESSTQGGRKRAELFMDLPDKEAYPDYYTYIEQPISLSEIKQRAEEDQDAPEEIVSDLKRMCTNALRYNAEGSEVYEDAEYFLGLVEALEEELA